VTSLEIVALDADSMEIEILPAVGARLHRLRVDGHDLLRTPPDVQRHVDDPYFWGSYPMAPWCNRIAAGRTAGVAGRTLDLPVSFPDGTAIHGQVSRVPWERVDDRSFRIQAGGDGWPWRYEALQRFEPGADALRLTLALTNLDDGPMPAGIGIHPWWRRPVRVGINAAAAYPSNLSTPPEPSPVAGDLDRHRVAEMPDGLDATWTDVGSPPVTLEWATRGIRATLTTDPVVDHIVAASPADIDAVAIEPQTHAPDAVRRLLNRERGRLALLPPGETMMLAIRLGFESLET
jgi:aldose 1-epimerase